MARLGTVCQVQEALAGPQARQDFLAQAGYAGRPEGLAARLAMELGRALPLKLDRVSLEAFGRHFNLATLVSLAKAEAALPAPALHLDTPASRLGPATWAGEEAWPHYSGQRLLRLARAGVAARDLSLALAASNGLTDFISHNPPLMGPGWAEAELVAVRSLNWLMALRFLVEISPLSAELALGAALNLQITAQVLEQALADDPHQVGPAAGLLFLGRCLSFLPQAGAWTQTGRVHLGPALQAWQGPEDLSQGSPPALAAHWGGLALWLLGPEGVEELAPLLIPLASLCRAQAPPWSQGPLWQQAPLPSLLVFEPQAPQPQAVAANLAALLLEVPEVRAERGLDEGIFWLLGSQAVEGLRRLAGGRLPAPQDLPGAGLSWLGAEVQGRRLIIWLRSAPRGQDPQEMAQASAMDLAILIDGQPLLMPPGPAGSGPLAPYLASRAAHSVVVLDQAQPARGKVTLEAMEAGTGHHFLAFSFDGYADLDDPALLRRRVHLDKDRGLVTVVDQVMAQGRHLVEALFHLPPEAQVEPDPQGGLLLSGAFGRARMLPEAGCQVQVIQGSNDPPLGWRALGQGQVAPAPVVRLSRRVVGDASLSTVFSLLAD